MRNKGPAPWDSHDFIELANTALHHFLPFDVDNPAEFLLVQVNDVIQLPNDQQWHSLAANSMKCNRIAAVIGLTQTLATLFQLLNHSKPFEIVFKTCFSLQRVE